MIKKRPLTFVINKRKMFLKVCLSNLQKKIIGILSTKALNFNLALKQKQLMLNHTNLFHFKDSLLLYLLHIYNIIEFVFNRGNGSKNSS